LGMNDVPGSSGDNAGSAQVHITISSSPASTYNPVVTATASSALEAVGSADALLYDWDECRVHGYSVPQVACLGSLS
jgi:hypothetical protein